MLQTGDDHRVLRPGVAPVAGPIDVVGRNSDGPTVLEAHRDWS